MPFAPGACLGPYEITAPLGAGGMGEVIRAEERRKTGQFQLHGVPLQSVPKTVELGRKLAEYRAAITAEAFQRSAAGR